MAAWASWDSDLDFAVYYQERTAAAVAVVGTAVPLEDTQVGQPDSDTLEAASFAQNTF